jgi:opacity protein-like surface antigen
LSYLKIGIFAVAFLLLSSTAYAADNSQWCGLMTALYGVCSPQLIDNYLMMTKNPPKPPNTIRASAITTYTAVLVKEAGTGVSSPPTSQAGAVIQDVPAPAYRYSWYWNGAVWVKSRLIN